MKERIANRYREDSCRSCIACLEDMETFLQMIVCNSQLTLGIKALTYVDDRHTVARTSSSNL